MNKSDLEKRLNKLERKAASQRVTFTDPDGQQYSMMQDERLKAAVACLYGDMETEQSDVLLEAVECDDDSSIHTLLSMLADDDGYIAPLADRQEFMRDSEKQSYAANPELLPMIVVGKFAV
jgi:uncharacterized coiled-coil protein SlyX